MRKDFCFKIGL